ncbi:TonB-dependent receptor plug domain-containing protein [Spongiimicrobium sp. 2-473A-2-J]|uniref:TonB-dependent receptor plug domain-containing protein n=1 Tax=Eudoraea algarum TaxID=3417568 RepID=UPI003D363599
MKNTTKKLLIFGSLMGLLGFHIPMQQSGLFDQILGRLTIYATKESPEKVYLHTDKDFYTRGETIWFSTYLVDGITHRASNKSNVIYVELLDSLDRVVEQRIVYADSLGVGGEMELGEQIAAGNYLLRAYTKYMLNNEDPVFFQKQLPIAIPIRPGPPATYDASGVTVTRDTTIGTTIEQLAVSFFPEGGHLVAGMTNTLGVKITGAQGNGVAIRGYIRDQENKPVAEFTTKEFGLGTVGFIPNSNTTYHATVDINGRGKTFELPEIMPSGYVLHIENKGDHLLLDIKANTVNGLVGTMLLGHLRGNLFFKHIGKSEEKDTYTIKLLTDRLDDGVAHFTLFTALGEPVCERLVFIDQPKNDAKLSVLSYKDSYVQRDRVFLNLRLKDSNEKPLAGNFSISVSSRNDSIVNGTAVPNIKSWLLLDSDLGATVQDPGYFFRAPSAERKELLNALMLTHGWRRFVWKELVQQKVSKKLLFPPEKGLMISGKTTAFKNSYKVKPAVVTLGIFDEGVYQEKKNTNAQGKFSFGPFSFQDSIKVVLDAIDPFARKKGKEKDIAIIVDPVLPKIVSKSIRKAKFPLPYARATQQADNGTTGNFTYDPDVIQLDEAVVKEKKKTRAEIINEEINSLTLHGKARNRMFIDSFPGAERASVMDVLRMIPGVEVEGRYPNQVVKIRGGINSINLSIEPMYLLDGIQVPQDVIQGMQTFGVLFVDVLTGAEASIYGVRAANGVIAVYTDRGLRFRFEQERYPGITNFSMAGFYKAREFYTPNYRTPKPEHRKPDQRTTLYWEPNMYVNGKNQRPISFYTGDRRGTFWVKLEGMTRDGRPVSTNYAFEVD